MRTDELVAHGMSRDEARAEALRRFGDLEYTRRYCRGRGEGTVMAGIGILIGIGAALALTHLMESILFGVGARDPVTLAAVTALVVAVALLATVFPARHAARVEPVLALRAE